MYLKSYHGFNKKKKSLGQDNILFGVGCQWARNLVMVYLGTSMRWLPYWYSSITLVGGIVVILKKVSIMWIYRTNPLPFKSTKASVNNLNKFPYQCAR